MTVDFYLFIYSDPVVHIVSSQFIEKQRPWRHGFSTGSNATVVSLFYSVLWHKRDVYRSLFIIQLILTLVAGLLFQINLISKCRHKYILNEFC